MKRLSVFLISLGGGTVLAASLPSALEIESLGPPVHESLSADNCTITKVDVNNGSIFVSFTGPWSLNYGYSGADGNDFSVIRDKAVSQSDWDLFVRRFRTRQGKPVAITITSTTGGGFIVRGGTPIIMFRFPTDIFEISSPAAK